MLLTFSSLIPVIPESRSSLLEKFSSHPSHIHTSTLLSHTDCMWKENDKGRHEHSSVARSPTGYKMKEMTVVKPPQSFCSQQFSINVGESCFPARRWRQYKMKTKNEMCQGNSSKIHVNSYFSFWSASLSSIHQNQDVTRHELVWSQTFNQKSTA